MDFVIIINSDEETMFLMQEMYEEEK